MVGEFTLIVNAEPTVTVDTAVPVQPAFVAVTVYDVVAAGETLIGLVVAPLLQEYVVPAEPPVAVKVAVPPGQMVGEFTLIDKAEPTVTVAMSVPVQPALVPVTV
jgi:hypothetical protein